MDSILKFNDIISKDRYQFSLIEYSLTIKDTFFNDYDKMKFLYLYNLPINNDDFTITTDKLYDFNLINKLSVKTFIMKNKFIENIDFIIKEPTNKKIYLFNPKSFKNGLLNSPNNEYKDYYLIIENIINGYQDYQRKFEKSSNLFETEKYKDIKILLNDLKYQNSTIINDIFNLHLDLKKNIETDSFELL